MYLSKATNHVTDRVVQTNKEKSYAEEPDDEKPRVALLELKDRFHKQKGKSQRSKKAFYDQWAKATQKLKQFVHGDFLHLTWLKSKFSEAEFYCSSCRCDFAQRTSRYDAYRRLLRGKIRRYLLFPTWTNDGKTLESYKTCFAPRV